MQVATNVLRSRNVIFRKQCKYLVNLQAEEYPSMSKAAPACLTVVANNIYNMFSQDGKHSIGNWAADDYQESVFVPQDNRNGGPGDAQDPPVYPVGDHPTRGYETGYRCDGQIKNANGYAKWMDIYENYFVRSATITVTFQLTGMSIHSMAEDAAMAPPALTGARFQPVMCFIHKHSLGIATVSRAATAANFTTGDAQEFATFPNTRKQILVPATGAGGASCSLSMNFTSKRWQGIQAQTQYQGHMRNLTLTPDNYGGRSGEQTYFTFGVMPAYGHASVISETVNRCPVVAMTFRISYNTNLTEPQNNPVGLTAASGVAPPAQV